MSADVWDSSAVVQSGDWRDITPCHRKSRPDLLPCPSCGCFAIVEPYRMPHHGGPILMAMFSVSCGNGLCAHRCRGVLHDCAEGATAAWNRRDMNAIIAGLGQFDSEQLRTLEQACKSVAWFNSSTRFGDA